MAATKTRKKRRKASPAQLAARAAFAARARARAGKGGKKRSGGGISEEARARLAALFPKASVAVAAPSASERQRLIEWAASKAAQHGGAIDRLQRISLGVRGARLVTSQNPRRSSMSRRRRRAMARRSGNPLYLSNKRRKRRNSPGIRFFNPGGIKAIPGKVASFAKSAVSADSLKKSAVGAVTVLASYGIPARLAPQYDAGVPGIALTLGAGVGVAALLSAVAPALAPTAVAATGIATALKALLIYGRGIVGSIPGLNLGDFLTIQGMGQIPAGLIQGARGMGDFLTTSAPVTAMGPVRSAALGGERFSDFS